MHYRGAKLVRYTQAVEDLEALGIKRAHAFLKAFVKGEFVNLVVKTDPAPRLIQPRDPRYNALLGTYIQPLERRIYRGIKRIFGDHTVMKGFNASQVGEIAARKWGKFINPVGLGLDASRFDQHVSVAALTYEHSVYINAMPQEHREELRELLSWQIHNIGYGYLAEAVVQYFVEGRRMSGDMNTALGNCLLMCAMVWSYARVVGVQVELMNNGDDCMVIMESHDLDKFRTPLSGWFTEMGFTMKVEQPVYVLEQMEFCQTKPVCVDGTWIMCRNPAIASSKDTMWKTPSNTASVKPYLEWLHSVGVCGSALSGGMPVMQEFYAALQRIGRASNKDHGGPNYVESGFYHMAKGMGRSYAKVSPESRYSFWRAWGITPDSQEAAENFYRNLEVPEEVRPLMDHQSITCETPFQVLFDD
jgi:hypothetical protein